MKKLTCCLALGFCLCLNGLISGQEVFSGAGIRSTADGDSPNRGWSLFNNRQQSGQLEGQNSFRMPWGKKQDQSMNTRSTETNWFGQPKQNSMQQHDPNAPGFFQSANQKSREFFTKSGHTMSNWANRTGQSFKNMNQNLKQSTARTWGSITRGAPQMPWSKGENRQANQVQPPLRSADNWFDKNKER